MAEWKWIDYTNMPELVAIIRLKNGDVIEVECQTKVMDQALAMIESSYQDATLIGFEAIDA